MLRFRPPSRTKPHVTIAFQKKSPRSPISASEELVESDDELAIPSSVPLAMVNHRTSAASPHPLQVVEDFDFAESYLSAKYQSDRALLRTLLCNYDIHKLKDARWLFVSMQTYGDVDGVCVPAELAAIDFSLDSGIVDEFDALLGPWRLKNGASRRRASAQAFDTHRLPLHASDSRFLNPKQILTELVGRAEPRIAIQEGNPVGIYARDPNPLSAAALAPAFADGRRPLVVLRQELRDVRSAFAFLGAYHRLDYSGWPTQDSRFVLADALVDAIFELADIRPPLTNEWRHWLRSFGQALPVDWSTSWERALGGPAWRGLFCPIHAIDRNACCAVVTAARAALVMLDVLDPIKKRSIALS